MNENTAGAHEGPVDRTEALRSDSAAVERTGGDMLVFEANGSRFAIGTDAVTSIVEADKISSIPGQTGFIKGVISLRGEPVAVVDLSKAFEEVAKPDGSRAFIKGHGRIVVVRDRSRTLGLYIGTTKPYFLWNEEVEGFLSSEQTGKYIKETIKVGQHTINLIDWGELFEKASRILATEETNV